MNDDVDVPIDADQNTRVAQYGCLRPLESAAIDAQMRAGARYYNELIALERTRRVVYRDLRRQHSPELDALEADEKALVAQLEEKREAIKGARKEARARAATADLDAEAKQLREQLRTLRTALKEARERAKASPELAKEIEALEARGKVWHRALRATTSAYWGTYLGEEASFQQARKAVVDPTFRRARGFERGTYTGQGAPEGRIGVQLQGGLSVAGLLAGTDTRLRLVDAPASMTGSKRRARLRLLYIRIGSEGRAPIWAAVPLVYHRPLPPDAVIKWCTVQRRVEGLDERWVCSITYALPAVPMPMRPGVVAIDLGWRKRPDASLRVAYWVDDQGKHGEICMPEGVRARLRKTRDLREIQDRHFNRIMLRLQGWLRARDAAGLLVPDWLQGARAWLAQTRSHRRLRELVLHWRQHRFHRDAVIFAAVLHWLHRSRHLYQWEVGAHRGALRARREVYRIAAAKLARSYGTVVVERFDLTAAKRLPAPEDHDEQAPRAQRAQLHQAAPGELRAAIVNAITRDGGVVADVDAAGTTSHCHACGGICVWDQGKSLHHTCEHCGELWDQDFNAATNLLRLWTREQSGDAQHAGGARKPAKRAARFAKRHAPKGAKDDAAEGSRGLRGRHSQSG
jgi:hypothetical protein